MPISLSKLELKSAGALVKSTTTRKRNGNGGEGGSKSKYCLFDTEEHQPPLRKREGARLLRKGIGRHSEGQGVDVEKG